MENPHEAEQAVLLERIIKNVVSEISHSTSDRVLATRESAPAILLMSCSELTGRTNATKL